LPSFSESKLSSIRLEGKRVPFLRILYEKQVLKLLTAPYETDCIDYNGNIKSQAQCINEVLLREFLRNKCLPKNDMLTFVVNNKNYSEFGYRFCENDSFIMRNKILISSLRKCRKECYQEFYHIWYSNDYVDLTLKSLNQKYIAIQHKPEMVFMQYLVNIGGLLGLWHGLSYLELKNLIIKLMNKILSAKLRLRNFRKYFPIIKLPKRIQTCLKLQVNFYTQKQG
jgi:hypothetical protein